MENINKKIIKIRQEIDNYIKIKRKIFVSAFRKNGWGQITLNQNQIIVPKYLKNKKEKKIFYSLYQNKSYCAKSNLSTDANADDADDNTDNAEDDRAFQYHDHI